MGHGTVADEIKGSRGGAARRARSSRSRRRACGSAPTSTAASASSAPRSRCACRRSCTRTSCSRSTSARRSTSIATTPPARPSAPIAGSTRCIALARRSTTARGRSSTAIVQGGVYEDLRVAVGRGGVASGAEGIAIGGSLGREKAQMYEVVDWSTRELERHRGRAPAPPAGDRRDRRPDPRRRARHRHASTARCRRGWRATASRSSPTRRPLAARGRPARLPRRRGAADRRLPCPACAGGLSRALPAPPGAHRRADRRAAADAAQPDLRRRP